MRMRRGMVLGICLLVLLMLGLMVGTIHMLSRQSYTELKRVDGFLRAVAVAESAFTRLLARVESVPWNQRWFKDAVDTGSGTWEDGRYDYVIGNAPSPLEADLAVRATADRTSILMLWRLRADPATLSPHRRLRTVYFGYGDPSLTPGPGALGPIDQTIDGAIATREANRPWANEKEIELKGAPGLPGVGTVLGLPANPVIPDVLLPPVPGGASRPQEPVVGGASPPPPVPTFPPPDLGGGSLPNPSTAAELAVDIDEMEQLARDLEEKIGKLDSLLGGAEDNYSAFTRAKAGVASRRAACDGNPPPAPPCTAEERAELAACARNLATIEPPMRVQYSALSDRYWELRARADRLRARIEQLRAGGAATESLLQDLRGETRALTGLMRPLIDDIGALDRAARPLLSGTPCGRWSGI